MPLIDTGPYTAPYLVYDAPANEATKKIRETFKVDEETGYPEYYSWRNMAKIGPRYRPEDLYKYIGHHEPERDISTKVTLISICTIIAGLGHYMYNSWYVRRPLIAKFYWMPINTAIFSYCALKFYDMSLRRQYLKNNIYIDYMRKHPERFGEVYRPKLRECLDLYAPTR